MHTLHYITLGVKMTWDTATGTHRRGRSIGSFRKDKEDLALFEDLSMREDLDSPLGMLSLSLSSSPFLMHSPEAEEKCG